MPIVKKIDHSKKDEVYYGYEPPNLDEIHECVDSIISIYSAYIKKCGIPSEQAIYDDFILSKIAVRIDQRREYFRIYHENTYLSELRLVALQAYWILKYRPFKDSEIRLGGRTVLRVHTNEGMAIHMILGIIAEIHYGSRTKKMIIPTDYMDRISHSFREHDLTKESIMLITESLFQKVEPC